MVRPKIIIPIIIFLFLLIIISIIKNETRIIEKKLSKLNKQIILKEKDFNESELDFYFLTSPAEIEKKIKTLGLNNYSTIEKSKIFLSFSDFSNIQKKLSALKNYVSKSKKFYGGLISNTKEDNTGRWVINEGNQTLDNKKTWPNFII